MINNPLVTQYITQFDISTRQKLETVRKAIQDSIPKAEEAISYKMPAYKHGGKVLIYFAGYEHHIGLYATPTGHKEFATELSKYKQGKGSVQFPIDQTIPLDLISRIAKFRFDEVSNSSKSKPKTPAKPRIFTMSFASVYPLYITKVERKGRAKDEVDQVIFWLTGYDKKTLLKQIDNNSSFEEFFESAPRINPNVKLIAGSICGYKIQEIQDPLMQKIRYMDKLVDEIAQGKPMEKILRK